MTDDEFDKFELFLLDEVDSFRLLLLLLLFLLLLCVFDEIELEGDVGIIFTSPRLFWCTTVVTLDRICRVAYIS